MQEEAIYRCVNPACARPMPRPVNFCPWCGTAQAGVRAPAPAGAPDAADAGMRPRDAAAEAPTDVGTDAAQAAVIATAQLSGWSDAPEAPLPSTDTPDAHGKAQAAPDPARAASDAGTGPARAGRAGFWGKRAAPRAGAGTDTRVAADAHARDTQPGIRLSTLFGHGASAQASSPPPPPQSVPRPPLSPTPLPPRRKPVRLRWWLAVLLVLACVWYVARPNATGRIEARIAHASALAKSCKAREAQDELIALRKARATPAQLDRLQDALNDGAAACTRQRQHDKAWNEASAAAEAALADGNADRARARLQAYTRRWGDDARSRALRGRIEDARHPLAAPSGSP